jgi:hypothetical protein
LRGHYQASQVDSLRDLPHGAEIFDADHPVRERSDLIFWIRVRKAGLQMRFIIVKIILVIVLYLFLPLTALTYYVFRRRRRRYEVERIFARLPIDSAYQKIYDDETVGWYFLSAVGYASVVGSLGLMLNRTT